MTVRQLLDSVDARELMEWEAYNRLEPFGSMVNRRGHALTATLLANAHKKKGARDFTVRDFMPDFSADVPPRQSVGDQLKIVEALNVALKGRDFRKK